MGPVLLVSNHPNSLLDPVLLGLAAKRPVLLLAKAPLFEVPVFGRMIKGLGMIPAYRGSDSSSGRMVAKNLDSLRRAAEALGGRTVGRWLGYFWKGKVMMIRKCWWSVRGRRGCDAGRGGRSEGIANCAGGVEL
ncbi:MAG: 1-acyl-sn-glycerol-3-phosphate acyltransferase [Candidatus Synoicihabitans palmerolidicus]|nr:1-acyl-sn-glycerol-3-phosphate acyltransferase [Candidatus Synoicihabitans palmerolidicus]MCC5022141.1 1-acyl-sn-glycerol-3-phosphate acyltransferase [Candidatus Synoicihabitans palmerolidicus]